MLLIIFFRLLIIFTTIGLVFWKTILGVGKTLSCKKKWGYDEQKVGGGFGGIENKFVPLQDILIYSILLKNFIISLI